jgi:hypothetical protein
MLSGVARVHHHDGFKAAWQECGPNVVLKHLDNDAPSLQVGVWGAGMQSSADSPLCFELPALRDWPLQEGLHAQELSGLWAKKSVVCSSGATSARLPCPCLGLLLTCMQHAICSRHSSNLRMLNMSRCCCSHLLSGPFKLNNHTDWRLWRNSLPDNQLGGFM